MEFKMEELNVKREIFTNNTYDTEPYDIEAAKKKVLDFLGFPAPKRCCGYQVLVALFVKNDDEGFTKEDGTKSIIIAPESRVKDEKYRTNTGMVIQMGDLAYRGPNFEMSGPWTGLS